MKTFLKILLIALIPFSFVAVIAYNVWQLYNFSLTLKKVGIGQLDKDNTILNITLQFQNTSNLGITLNQSDFYALLDSVKLNNTTADTKHDVYIAPNANTELDVDISFTPKAFTLAEIEGILLDYKRIEIKGTLNISVWTIPLSIPVKTQPFLEQQNA